MDRKKLCEHYINEKEQLEKKVKALESENKRLQAELTHRNQQKAILDEENERLREWLQDSEHKIYCRYRITGEPDCTCGLDELLKEK